MTGVLIAESEAELRDRLAQQVEMVGAGRDTDEWLADREGRWIMGTPVRALERVARLEAAGVQRIMLQDFLPRDLDMVRLMGRVFAAA
jgi:alkanesulfonate monooxygenase SsuD/methylene tetrahydromethanopterin reductase-like flavin-dependent oxidoreductase (luciferase family)